MEPDNDPPVVRVRLLDPSATPPERAHAGDAGADLRACEVATIPPGGRAVVDCGIAIALPPGTVGLVHPRSGLAARHGVTVLNAPGTVDAGYRGPVKVVLANLGDEPFTVEPGMRVAQLVVQRVELATFDVVDDLDATDRGTGGFGSTGA